MGACLSRHRWRIFFQSNSTERNLWRCGYDIRHLGVYLPCFAGTILIFCCQLGSIFLVWRMLVYSRTVSSKTVSFCCVVFFTYFVSQIFSMCLRLLRPQTPTGALTLDPAGDFRPQTHCFLPISKFLAPGYSVNKMFPHFPFFSQVKVGVAQFLCESWFSCSLRHYTRREWWQNVYIIQKTA